jgi:LuxR family maltose regulon positive regulatory protein
MITPLLTTKLYVPPVRPKLVHRPRLIERLNEGLDRKLALVSAPAGFGKTTLLSEWVAGTDRPVAWVSLDKGDDDLTRFWAYLITALQSVQPNLGETALAALRSRQPPLIEPLLTGLINEIVTLSPPFVLVLDDVHVIANQQIHDGLTFLLDNLPPQMHLVLSSRSDPPWPLARLRARGEMTELRASDLRFSEQEAAAFLNEVMNLDLSAEDVAALEDRTEGWIVGLQMAALSMRGRKDGSALIAALTGTHRFILDYLVEEVLDQQSPAVQEFLLHTSILERLTAPLCNALTDGRNSRAILTQLEQANLFLVPLDDERRWYRYHRLFADLLRSRLERTHPDQVPVLHRRASEWYQQNGLIAEAVSYALAAGDVEQVARLVGGTALSMMEHGELITLERWLDALPDEVVRSQPWLCIAHAWMLGFTGQLDAVEPLLRDAEKAAAAYDGSPEGPRSVLSNGEGHRIRGHIAGIRALVAGMRGDALQAVERAREALEHLPADDLLTRGWAAMALALNLYQSGDVAAGDQALAETVAISRGTGDSHVAVLTLCNLAAVQTQRGQLLKAAATFRDALQLADEHAARAGRRLPVSGYAHTYLAKVLCEWNDLQAALHHVQEGIELCKQWGEPQLLTGAHMSLATVLQTHGDADGALDALHKAKQAASRISSWYAARVAPLEALIRLRQGDVPEASRWAVLQQNSMASYFDVFEYWFAQLTLARIDIAQGRFDQALESLAPLLEAAEAAGGERYVIESLALQAVALQAQGKLDQALTALERALTLAEPEGYVRTFIDEGAPMGTLLRQAQARGIQSNYVRKLLAALEGETKDQRPLQVTEAAPPSLVDRPSSPLIEPLSERELQVLRLLNTQLSSKRIAEQLFLSVNTVRSHIKSIYSKLDVHSRADAVRRAEELGLL